MITAVRYGYRERRIYWLLEQIYNLIINGTWEKRKYFLIEVRFNEDGKFQLKEIWRQLLI